MIEYFFRVRAKIASSILNTFAAWNMPSLNDVDNNNKISWLGISTKKKLPTLAKMRKFGRCIFAEFRNQEVTGRYGGRREAFKKGDKALSVLPLLSHRAH